MDTIIGYFMIDDWHGRAQFTVGSIKPVLVVLNSIRMQTEQVVRRNIVNNNTLWLLHQFLL